MAAPARPGTQLPERRPCWPVAIVGGGVAGSTLAWLLARGGLQAGLLEARPRPGPKVCGEYLSPAGAQLLERLGLKDTLPPQLFPPIEGLRIYSPAGRQVAAPFFSPGGQPAWGLALPREHIEAHLAHQASSSGAHLSFGERLRSLEALPAGRGWLLQTSRRTIRTPLLVGADGRTSRVARQLGLTRQQPARRIALHCRLPNRQPASRAGEMHLLSDGAYIGLTPISAAQLSLSLVCPAAEARLHRPQELLRRRIAQAPALQARLGELPPQLPIQAAFPVQQRVRRCAGPGYALIGDAAGLVDPLTGDGLHNALFMAHTLAAGLLRAHQAASPPKAAARRRATRRYARWHRRFFRQKTWLSTLFQMLIRRPPLVEALGAFLGRSPYRAAVFMGIIGNTLTPLQGGWRLALAWLLRR